MKRGGLRMMKRWNVKELNTVLAYAASLVLTGVPPAVCQSVLDDLYTSVKSKLTV